MHKPRKSAAALAAALALILLAACQLPGSPDAAAESLFRVEARGRGPEAQAGRSDAENRPRPRTKTSGNHYNPGGAPDPLTRAHAHNDYAHERPLLDALENRFHSVEADVWLDGDTVMVSHNPGRNSRGALEDLYVAPLARRVREHGSVHGNGETFLLWIDLKQDSRELRDGVHRILKRYADAITRYSDQEIHPAPIEVILTGSAGSKTRYCEEHAVRFATRDGGYDPEAPAADTRWRWCAMHWSSNIQWDGVGEIQPEQRGRLRRIVQGVHRQGRRLRFWATPETPAFWRLACEEGLDLINTDRLEALRCFLEDRGAGAAAARNP